MHSSAPRSSRCLLFESAKENQCFPVEDAVWKAIADRYSTTSIAVVVCTTLPTVAVIVTV
jgi:hypothetical protein